jgi:acyl-[acyl-carrier-protein]-phospholipid O-acyltransferase/long-chain-fatty-acid--[acyl-carrier-protein] ligase
MKQRLMVIFPILIAAATALLVAGTFFSLSFGGILAGIGIVLLAGTLLTLVLNPVLLIRLLAWGLMHTIYRMTVVGARNIPKKGGALIVCNSVSYVDHALLYVAFSRPMRLFMGREFYEYPLLKPIVRAVKAIPVSNTDSPTMIGRALKEARKAIEEGELVCIFAEGDLTRTGNMLPFGRGLEFIMRGLEAPIIPMQLDRIWGSTFSLVDGKLHWRFPKVLPYPVTISCGKPMSARSSTYQVRLAVQELSADAFKLRGKSQKKLHIAFIDRVKRHPFKFCMADSMGTHLSYAKTLAGMLSLSAKLFPAGQDEPADEKVGVLLPTSCGSVLVNGAVLLAGKIPVNLNYTSSKEVLDSCTRQCGMRMVITSRAFLEKVNIAPNDKMIFMEDVKASIKPLARLRLYLAVLLLPAFLLKRLFVRGDRVTIDDTATIIFSSGSTGEPKGIVLTHQNITSNIEGFYQVIGLKTNDVFMGILPFFHSFGYTTILWLPLYAGVSAVYHSSPLDAATIGELVDKYRATIILGTPTFLANYTRKCTPEQFKSLRLVVAGAEKLKRSVAEIFYQKYGVPVFEGYGCSELSPVVSLGIPSYIHPEGKFIQVGNKPGTVGHPLPGVAAKVVHPETFADLGAGERGLLLIKGPNVMKGYLNNPEKTAQVIRNGWYVTGDIVAVDEDGFIAITDRLSRFSKIGGEMVPHIKIEEEIHNILESAMPVCAVSAVPDDRKGERLVVLYAAELDVTSLWDRLNGRDLPKLWIPKKESFYRIEAIPLLGSGKLDLKRIRELAAECAGCVKR